MVVMTISIANTCASNFLGVSKGLHRVQQEICKCILVQCCQCMYVIIVCRAMNLKCGRVIIYRLSAKSE